MEYLVGLLTGLVLGLTGAGGSVFAVPLLVYLVHLTPQEAVGVSLGAVSFSALFGVLTRLRSRQIAWLPALVYAVLGAACSPLGVHLNQRANPRLLMVIFSLLVLLIAARMWYQAVHTPQQTRTLRSSLPERGAAHGALCRMNQGAAFKIGLPCVAGMALGAVLTGLLSGLFGVGGGFLIVPTLLFLTGISIQQAVATSLVVISLVSLSGFTSFMLAGSPVELALLGRVSIAGVVGMAAGVIGSRHLAGPLLQKIFAALMLSMALLTLFTTYLN